MLRPLTHQRKKNKCFYLNCKFINRDYTYSERDCRECIRDLLNISHNHLYLTCKMCWNVSTWEKSPISLMSRVCLFTDRRYRKFLLPEVEFDIFQMIDSNENWLFRVNFSKLWRPWRERWFRNKSVNQLSLIRRQEIFTNYWWQLITCFDTIASDLRKKS